MFIRRFSSGCLLDIAVRVVVYVADSNPAGEADRRMFVCDHNPVRLGGMRAEKAKQ